MSSAQVAAFVAQLDYADILARGVAAEDLFVDGLASGLEGFGSPPVTIFVSPPLPGVHLAVLHPIRLLKKSIHGLFQHAKQKAWFLLCFIFQTR